MPDRDDYWFFQRQTAPAFLAGPQGENWWQLWGHTKDAWREGAREATKTSLPLLAAPDSLGAYAAERNTERYPAEAEAAYRVRLVETFDRWQLGGTPRGVIDAVAVTPGITDVGYYEAWQWDPGVDGGAGWSWARFWLVLGSTWGPPPACGDGSLCGADGLLCGVSGVSLETIDFLRRQARRWRAAHARQVALMVKIGDALICGEPGVVCGEPGVVCGAGSVAHL